MSADFNSGANFARMLIGTGQGLTGAANNASLAGFQLASNSEKMKEAAKQAQIELNQRAKQHALDLAQKQKQHASSLANARTVAAITARPRYFHKVGDNDFFDTKTGIRHYGDRQREHMFDVGDVYVYNSKEKYAVKDESDKKYNAYLKRIANLLESGIE